MNDPDDEFGGATEAAEVLGLSVSQFNALRLRDTYIYDPVDESLTKVDPDRENVREHFTDEHLVAPVFAGQRLAGGRWRYNLTLLREYRRKGWPGARFAH